MGNCLNKKFPRTYSSTKTVSTEASSSFKESIDLDAVRARTLLRTGYAKDRIAVAPKARRQRPRAAPKRSENSDSSSLKDSQRDITKDNSITDLAIGDDLNAITVTTGNEEELGETENAVEDGTNVGTDILDDTSDDEHGYDNAPDIMTPTDAKELLVDIEKSSKRHSYENVGFDGKIRNSRKGDCHDSDNSEGITEDLNNPRTLSDDVEIPDSKARKSETALNTHSEERKTDEETRGEDDEAVSNRRSDKRSNSDDVTNKEQNDR